MTDDKVVLVVGSLNMDLVVEVEKHPQPGDTVLGADVKTFPGGKGANQAVAAGKAGGRVRMLGKVGSDDYGQLLKTSLVDAAVDVSLVAEQLGPSGMAFITVDAKGENMIVVSPGANRQLLVDDLRPEHFEGVGLILMQLETPLETIEAVAQKAFELNIPVMLNAAPAQPLADDLLQRISYLIVNEGEAALLTGRAIETKEEALEAAKVLQKKGCRNVIVTLGAEGVVWSGAESGQLSAHPVKVIDTTAAGDAFCGALAVKLAEGAPLAKAIAFANAAGALATTKKGAQPSLPLRKDIEAFLKR